MNGFGQTILTDREGGNIDALPSGTVLLNGQYVIDRYLSSGGFGITYLARDSLDRRVVIKECYPEALCLRKAKTVRARSTSHANEFQSLVGMFVREARSISKLDHPHIIGVHQVFEDNETAYMALDLIDGQDLLQIIECNEDPLSASDIVLLLRKLLDAIGTVHGADMLHRDISPDNVLLDGAGNPILIDFGAAREEASKKSRAISTMLVVKDGYSPQEFYISTGQQGPWSDLYSLAATFVHLISGEAPPNSQNRLAALAANNPDPYQPLAGRIDGYDDAFLRAIDKTMNVFPQDRLRSAREWLDAIDGKHSPEFESRTDENDGDILTIVASLVSEVDKDLEADRLAAPPQEVDARANESAVPEKQWEYLLPEDEPEAPEPEEPQQAAPRRNWLTRLKNRPDTDRSHKPLRGHLRRSSVVVMLGAILFNVTHAPDANLATVAAAEINHLIDFARDLAMRVRS